jgi:pimeloyl-ACP methyl ester carboxylesterase
VGEARLAYDLAGQGAPLVLVHAGIADRRMWDPQFLVFAEHFRVARCDLRGFGESEPVAGEFSHAADLLAVLDGLGLERAHLVGCSKGGSACLELALDHPERVSGLVLVGSGPSGFQFETPPPRQWDEVVAAFRAGDLDRTSELEVQIWVDGPHRALDQVDPAIRRLVFDMNRIALGHEVKGLGNELPPPIPAADRLGTLSTPTLVIVGELDQPTPVAAAEFMAARIPNARHIVLPDTAHLPNLELPAEFNRLVLGFLLSLAA